MELVRDINLDREGKGSTAFNVYLGLGHAKADYGVWKSETWRLRFL